MKRIVSALAVCLLALTSVNAQDGKGKHVMDYHTGADIQHGTNIVRHWDYQNRVLKHQSVREDDVYWHKQYISAINLKLRKNQPLYFPVYPTLYRKSFVSHVIEAVTERKILQAYEDEYFTEKLTAEEVAKSLYRIDTVEVEDWETGAIVMQPDTITILSSDIIEILVREERFFDKKRGVMDVRIIGICPVALVENSETGEYEKQKLFWFYYPEARPMLANANIYNVYNSAERMTMDEFFLKRLYSSVIKKESNLQDRSIFDYANYRKIDQLLEAERIKEDIRSFEHDLWFY
jgi:gliding motility associated protien GldN